MPRQGRAVEAYTRTAMAEKAPKRKAKPKREPQSVLGTLPASRPERLGRPRQRANVSQARQAAPDAAVTPARPAAKRAPATANGRDRKPRAATGAASAGPQAVRPASPPLRAAHPCEPPPKPIGAPTGTELVTTTIRAAGELAQISLTVGGKVLKRTIDRIPRP